MLDGVLEAPSFFTSVGKCSGDADGAHGVEPVGILDDLCFNRFGSLSFILTKRY